MQDNRDFTPQEVKDLYAARKGRNRAVVLTIFGLCALFFVITIVRMG